MPSPAAAVGLAPRTRLDIVAQNVQNLLGKFASAFSGIGLSVLLGFDPPASLRPFQAVLTDNRTITIAMLVVIVVVGAGSFLITRRSRSRGGRGGNPLIRILRTLGESLAEIIVGFLAGLLLGIGSAPSTIPLLTLIRTHPPIGIGMGAALLAVLILAPLIGGEGEEQETTAHDGESSATFSFSRSDARLRFASATSFVSLLLLFSLFLMITIRPSWCPTSVCPAPELVVVTNPHGVNDGILETFYLAQQSTTFALTQNPATYTFNNLPNSIGAMEIGSTGLPYRAVIGIHSLQRDTRYGLVIDGVDMLIDRADPISAPVNVFDQGANLSYSTRLYTVIYNDETAPATVPTTPPSQVISLEVGGSDEIAVQVTTSLEVALQFRLRVRYHQIVGATASRSLVIPHEFAVDFIGPTHWKPYSFVNGKMTPIP